MKFVLLLLSIATSLHAADLKLTDGRVLKDWSFLSQTASSVFVKHAGGATKVAKKLLPSEILAKYPIDVESVAREEKALADADAAGRARKAEVDAAAKKEYDDRVSKAAASQPRPKTRNEKSIDAQIAVLAAQGVNADGLSIDRVRMNVWSAFLMIKNNSNTSHTLEFRQMRGKLRSGTWVEPSEIRMANVNERTDYLLEAGQAKNFELIFMPVRAPTPGSWDWVETVDWKP